MFYDGRIRLLMLVAIPLSVYSGAVHFGRTNLFDLPPALYQVARSRMTLGKRLGMFRPGFAAWSLRDQSAELWPCIPGLPRFAHHAADAGFGILTVGCSRYGTLRSSCCFCEFRFFFSQLLLRRPTIHALAVIRNYLMAHWVFDDGSPDLSV